MKEQAYLRSELNSRIMLTYTHSHTTMTFVITVWSVLITLISFLYTNFADHYEIISIVAPLIVLITLCYIFFASQKYKENLHQIIKISSYYACFYNFIGLPSDDCNAWELITMDMQENKEYAPNKKEEVLPRMNGEYTFFAILACVINLALFVVSVVFYFETVSVTYIIFYCIEYFFIALISIFLVIKISNNTSLKHYHEEHANMFVAWLKYAITHKYITKEEVEEKYSGLNNILLEKIRCIV